MARIARFPGARVLITGGAKGMGAMMARGAIERGAETIVAWDIDRDGLQSLAQELSQKPARVITDVVDVASDKAVARAAGSVIDTIGGIDVLIHSAGVISGKHFKKTQILSEVIVSSPFVLTMDNKIF